eukprot:3730295-Pyramimonas_sp.AAC.1
MFVERVASARPVMAHAVATGPPIRANTCGAQRHHIGVWRGSGGGLEKVNTHLHRVRDGGPKDGNGGGGDGDADACEGSHEEGEPHGLVIATQIRMNQTQEAQVYSHDGPIGRLQRQP